MPVVPRPLLPAALSDDPEADMQQVAAQVEQELARLRQEDLAAYHALEAAAQQMGEGNEQAAPPLLATLQQFIQADSWNKSHDYLQTHPELLTEEAVDCWLVW